VEETFQLLRSLRPPVYLLSVDYHSAAEKGSLLSIKLGGAVVIVVLQLHARALLPHGNFFKALHTKWRLFQAMVQSGSNPEKAAQLEDKLLGEVSLLHESAAAAAAKTAQQT
jgi:hypothetical protein